MNVYPLLFVFLNLKDRFVEHYAIKQNSGMEDDIGSSTFIKLCYGKHVLYIEKGRE